ncbi:MAG: YiiX/YebB-like N1pC/P60 family cysteine hydrolase [Aureliella sp.]
MPGPNQQQTSELQTTLSLAAKSVLDAAPALELNKSIKRAFAAACAANERGYFKPDEDELLRMTFRQYLAARRSLQETIRDLKPLAIQEVRKEKPDHPEIFLIAFAAGAILMRSAKTIVDAVGRQQVVWKKLDEAEPRFGIPRKQYTRIFRSLTSPSNVVRFLQAISYWERHQREFEKDFSEVSVYQDILGLIERETPELQRSKRYHTTNRLRYRLHSLQRRQRSGWKNATFALFELSGRVISEIRWPWKRKRITPGVRKKLGKLLRPGDVIITRHDDAATNFFLPGFWPHSALYIGTPEQRSEMEIQLPSGHEPAVALAGFPNEPISILEARKDGVLLRPLADTLQVDACTVLRPKLSEKAVREAIHRGLTHSGKAYDFEFDFRRSDCLVCTEVIYRSYHGIESMNFELSTRAGRFCLSAEDLLDSAIDKHFFDVVAVYGVKANRFATGESAKEQLIESYRSERKAV